MNKKELRKKFIQLRNALSEEMRKEKSKRIASRVIAMQEFQKTEVVLLYNAIRSEVETKEIFQEAKRLGKPIYFPRVIGDEMEFYLIEEDSKLEVSSFGIYEPEMSDEKRFLPKEQNAVFVLMPGVAFDKAGNRIGYGGGYYDKYLKWLQENLPNGDICKAAVGYECQMLDKEVIETEEYDMRCDYIVTEERVLKVK